MENATILWADDEIDLLKPHVLFLEQKGYKVVTVNNGNSALDEMADADFDIVLLDENMPGKSGLETLMTIKEKYPSVPVIMITKSEEESIMEEAIGSKISDYLIKPVNPNQILLSLKKNLDTKRLVSEKSSSSYQREFREIGMRLGDRLNFNDWTDLYKKIVHWDLELENTDDEGMTEILQMQKNEANQQFSKFVSQNYASWVNGEDAPVMSHTLFKKAVASKLNTEPLFFLVIDNLRYDQWRVIRPLIREYFTIKSEEMYSSILPTATQYARNAIFSGLLPSEMEKKHPDYWKNDHDEGGKNKFEYEFLQAQLKRLGKNVKSSYNKITNLDAGKKLADNYADLLQNNLNVIVYNFVDMLSHARTDMKVIRELADNEAAYRSLTLSWFEHSPLFDILKKISESGKRVIITTDHGTIHVDEPSKIVGDKDTNTNLRYKQGRNLQYNQKDVYEIKNPYEVFLPKANVSTRFVFAKGKKFFAYPNNYNYYANYYKDTFQHGGISLEEMLIPLVELEAK